MTVGRISYYKMNSNLIVETPLSLKAMRPEVEQLLTLRVGVAWTLCAVETGGIGQQVLSRVSGAAVVSLSPGG